MKKLVLFVLFLLFLIPISTAIGTTRYPNPAGLGFDYSNEGRGEFILINDEFDFNQFSKNLALSSPFLRLSPLPAIVTP